MKIYFVRHGEGDHNVNDLFSAPDFSLTKLGKQQAAFAGQRVKDLPIEVIVASSYLRTKQTAEIINQKLHKKIITTDLAIEIKRPSEIAGKNQSDPEIKKIKKQMDDNFHLENWHYSDEENFYDLKKRVEQFIKYLEKFKEQHILVVSHLHTIRMIILSILFGETLTAEMFMQAAPALDLETSGLTICEKDHQGWKLITWNDHAHLTEVSKEFSG